MLRLNFRDCNGIEHALHIQSHWRFKKHNRIFVGSFDLTNHAKEELEYRWGNTLADSFLEKLINILPLRIIRLKINTLRDISIIFDHKITFECFIDSSKEELEHWRWIDLSHSSPKHIVFKEV
ncbi:hypothetical protein BBW65_05660 [Helicobacter enhydrae]|uniref:Uncharacterized protein n=2 Tax=Helicobacter enhydrae TaxID=222136 RepID=A0A1B1U6K3_9HELI|nr:hypothetical protein BBW65_05660 [Helicobacter enhydrae]